MESALQFTWFLAAANGIAILWWWLPRMSVFAGSLPVFCGLAVMFTPLLIAPTCVVLRAVACFLAVDLFFKITDYANQREFRSCYDERFHPYLNYLIPFPVLLVRFEDQIRRSRTNLSGWQATGLAALGFCICYVLLIELSHATTLQSSFLLDHTIKFLLFALAIELLARLIHGIEHLVGFDTSPLINNVFLAKTVGEFWHRYNTRVHAWFDYNVFRSFSIRRKPVRAVLLTFFVSAVLHEIGFAIATSRWDGYQFLFFMLQAPGVIFGRFLQHSLSNTTMGNIAMRGSTVLWMWATSMLFFHGVNRIFPVFYSAEPWLP